MDTFEMLIRGFAVALTPMNLLLGALGCTFGTFIGAMPGIGAPTGIAVLLPMTFGMDPTGGIIMLAGIYYGAMYGGTITSVLVNVPGESSSVMTALEGHKMALKGRAGTALTVSAVGSFVAGTLGVVGLMLLAGPVSNFALKFGPPEQFSLFLFSFTCLVGFASESRSKTLVAIVVGLLIATVGNDSLSGRSRFTFGVIDLMGGIDFVTVAVGIFGIGEVMIAFEQNFKMEFVESRLGLRDIFPTAREWAASAWPIARGTVLGFLVGLLPAAGATVAAFMSYGVERQLSDHPEEFGKGAIAGVAGPESANNAATAGGMVPLLTLGIPSSASTAVMLGAFTIWGLRPGPLLFSKNPDFVWGLIASMYVGNVLLLILNLGFIPTFVRLLRAPFAVMMSLVVVFCVMGAYTLGGSVFDIWTMLAFGVLGYVMKKLDFPQAPLVFGVVLGPLAEVTFRQALTMSQGSPAILVGSPIAATLVTGAALVLAGPLAWTRVRRMRRSGKAAGV
jgi:putative tricarboxylic transport membrane protein